MLSQLLSVASLCLLTAVSVGGAPSAINLGPVAVNLRTAANFAILAKTGISTVPKSAISGGLLGVSPIAANALTGFALTLDSTGSFSTSSQATGHILAASYAAPTPATLTVAIGDMQTAFNDANGRVNPQFTNLANGAIGGLVLTPGLYKWSGGVSVSSLGVTITGTSADTFIFQVTGTLSVAGGARVTLAGGVRASNIVWVVNGAVTAGAGAHLEGVILGKTSVSLLTGTSLNGRVLSQTAVSLQSTTIVAQ